jgi:hypothetical protein
LPSFFNRRPGTRCVIRTLSAKASVSVSRSIQDSPGARGWSGGIGRWRPCPRARAWRRWRAAGRSGSSCGPGGGRRRPGAVVAMLGRPAVEATKFRRSARGDRSPPRTRYAEHRFMRAFLHGFPQSSPVGSGGRSDHSREVQPPHAALRAQTDGGSVPHPD